jgi:hypothetical protein
MGNDCPVVPHLFFNYLIGMKSSTFHKFTGIDFAFYEGSIPVFLHLSLRVLSGLYGYCSIPEAGNLWVQGYIEK